MAEFDKECVSSARAKGQLDGVHVLVGDQADHGTLQVLGIHYQCYSPNYLHTYLFIYHSRLFINYIPFDQSTYIHTYIHTYLFIYHSRLLINYIPFYQSIYLHTYIPVYLIIAAY